MRSAAISPTPFGTKTPSRAYRLICNATFAPAKVKLQAPGTSAEVEFAPLINVCAIALSVAGKVCDWLKDMLIFNMVLAVALQGCWQFAGGHGRDVFDGLEVWCVLPGSSAATPAVIDTGADPTAAHVLPDSSACDCRSHGHRRRPICSTRQGCMDAQPHPLFCAGQAQNSRHSGLHQL